MRHELISLKTVQGVACPVILTGRVVSKCSGAMAGDVNDAGVLKIFRYILRSREAISETMWTKISSPFAVCAIEKSISVPRLLQGGTCEAGRPDLCTK